MPLRKYANDLPYYSYGLHNLKLPNKTGILSKSTRDQNLPAFKIHPRSKLTQSNSRTAYRSRVRVRGNSEIK